MELIFLILGIALVILSGMFDAQKDYAKSNIRRWSDPQLWDKAPYYLYAGSGKNSGWRFKWKDGDHDKGEAFPGSTTMFVFVTDWFHMAKKFQLYFMMGGMCLMALYNPFTIFAYEILNHMGFQLATTHYNRTKKFLWFFQNAGYKIFLRYMNKHNKKLLDEYVEGVYS